MSDFLPVRAIPVHADDRGKLFEVLRFKDEQVPGDGYIYSITIAPGARRGDHYHLRKQEWFVCVSGEITVLAESPSGEKQRITVSAAEPTVVRFDPHVAHAFLNTGNETAIAVLYGSVQHDPSEPDSFSKVIDLN
jgi:UDP-2-acetamido-2,6-beta-L-arabino-hexul-4-ose reductase